MWSAGWTTSPRCPKPAGPHRRRPHQPCMRHGALNRSSAADPNGRHLRATSGRSPFPDPTTVDPPTDDHSLDEPLTPRRCWGLALSLTWQRLETETVSAGCSAQLSGHRHSWVERRRAGVTGGGSHGSDCGCLRWGLTCAIVRRGRRSVVRCTRPDRCPLCRGWRVHRGRRLGAAVAASGAAEAHRRGSGVLLAGRRRG